MKYSNKQFANYKYRVKFVARDEQGEDIFNFDVYTDEKDKKQIETELNKKLYSYITKHDLVCSYSKIENWATKEQDDHESKFINEILKDL